MASDLVVQFGNILDVPTIFPEEKGKVNVTVTNQGDTAFNGPVDLKLYASTDNQLDRNNLNTLGSPTGARGANDPLRGTDELLNTQQNNISINNLAPGQSQTITVDFAGADFRTPSVVSPGAYYLFAEAQPGNNITDSNTSNNTSSQLVTQGDVVIQWNSILLNAIQATGKGDAKGTPPPIAARNQAIVHAAIYDAVNAIDRASGGGHDPYRVNISASDAAGASKEAAAVEAAYRTLSELFPGQKAEFDTQRTRSLAGIPDGEAKTKGLSVGQNVANQIINLRRNDGTDRAGGGYTPGTDPGDFQIIPPELQPETRPPANDNNPALPRWGLVTPFAIRSVADFRPEGPPEFSSPLYGRDIERVRQLGAGQDTDVTKITRNADQTEVAQFWACDRDDTFRPPGQLNEVAQEISLARNTSLSDNARLFALLNIAEADAGIVGWDAKYTYEQLRPITAIRNADNDNNPQTKGDPKWESLLATPNFPDYISGHSVFAGAASQVLARFFGDNTSFDIPSQELPGVSRSYGSFSQLGKEDGDSRLYGGVHVDLATVDGVEVGQNVGNFVFDNILK